MLNYSSEDANGTTLKVGRASPTPSPGGKYNQAATHAGFSFPFPKIRMRKADLAVALLFLATTSASLGTGSPDSRRIPRTVTVYCDGTPHEFTLSRAAEASSPFTALRSKLSKHFGHLKYKNFFSMEGEPLDQFGLLPENVRASVPCGFRVDAVIFIDAPDGKVRLVDSIPPTFFLRTVARSVSYACF